MDATPPPTLDLPTTSQHYAPDSPTAGYALGARPRRDPPETHAPRLAALRALLEPHLWREIDWHANAGEFRDQGNQGSCVAFAATKALATAARLAGIPYPELSAGHLYGRINGGRDAGAWLADALTELRRNGCAPSAAIHDLSWQPSSWPPNAVELAAPHKILEFADCPTWPEIMTAVQLGFTVAAAIDIGRAFEPDRDNWVPEKRGTAGGHAMAFVGAAWHPTRRTWGLICQNSWAASPLWRQFVAVPPSYFHETYADAWAIRVTTDPSQPHPPFACSSPPKTPPL